MFSSYLKILLYLVILINFFYSCKKYDEGPYLFYHRIEKRIENKWNFINVLRCDTNETYLFSNSYLNFKNDGTIEGTGKYGDTICNGRWKLHDNKDFIEITFTYCDTCDTCITNKYYWLWKIKRLKQDQMWLEYTDSTDCFSVWHLGR